MRRLLTVVTILALTSALLGARSTIPSASAATTWPVKIFTVSTPSAKVDAALANRYVSGISSRFTWAALEPSPGQYRWTAIDNLIAKARAAGKLAMIRVIAGIYSPDWVKQRSRTLTFSDRYLYNPAAYPSQVTMPVPWDPTFRSLWFGFVSAFGARYDGNATIHSIQMAGGGFIGEMTLPTDVQQWRAAGYTDATYIDCWNRIVASYRTAFPRTAIVLDIAEPFGGVLTTQVVSPVVAFATTGTKKAYIQSNALRASALGNIGPYRTALRSVSSITRVGYQMIGDAPSVASLRDAFTVAIQDDASHVEVYGNDILDPANQTALRYLASDGTQ